MLTSSKNTSGQHHIEDPFRYYVKNITSPSKLQPQEFIQSFHEAVDAIKARREVLTDRFGRSNSKENTNEQV